VREHHHRSKKVEMSRLRVVLEHPPLGMSSQRITVRLGLRLSQSPPLWLPACFYMSGEMAVASNAQMAELFAARTLAEVGRGSPVFSRSLGVAGA